jgi:hypothetical protein
MKCEGELRRAKGALVFIPEGTENYLRVQWQGDLPEDFKTGKARAILVSKAEMVRDGKGLLGKLSPGDGIPEEICGPIVEKVTETEVVVNVGFPLHVILPEGKHIEGRLFASLGDSLVAKDTEMI